MSTLYQNVTNSTRYALRIIASEIAQYKPIMMLLSCLIVAILKVTNTVYSELQMAIKHVQNCEQLTVTGNSYIITVSGYW